MSRLIEELTRQEKQDIIQEILDKRSKNNDKQWVEIVQDFDLDCSPEALRKLGAGVKFASDSGMKFDNSDQASIDRNVIERQKLYDIQRGIKNDMRQISRTELLCERITSAIKSLPKIDVEIPKPKRPDTVDRTLVLGLGDFHYGADFNVTGLLGESINKYNSSVFEKRMENLLLEVSAIVEKEEPTEINLMIVGDMLDGLLRQSQLQRLEFGVVESTIRLAEYLSQWIAALANIVKIPVKVYAVRGNHGEIRPLGSKAGQFPEENMERIIMHYLHARFANDAWIIIETNDAPMTQVIDVCGFKFLLTHGQDSDIESMAQEFVNLYQKSIDVFVVGHLHKSQSFVSGIMPESNVRVERVPSICGIDPYAQSKGYGAHAGATVMIVKEGYGISCVYPIVLS